MKPSIPKGTRDFGPVEMSRRNYIFDTIREVFRLYGFQPIETPAMENLSTLMGKYGEEGDKLLFRILNSGNFMGDEEETISSFVNFGRNLLGEDKYIDDNDSVLSPAEREQKQLQRIASKICEKGLRYDLTVPFARFVVMHNSELTFPFRRYQIQPVWRADRPQKGRYREFFQCDADVVGSDSLLNEVELVQMVDNVFRKLGIRVKVKINNRKILAGIAEYIGEADRLVDVTTAIDKLDKIGEEKVLQELKEKGFADGALKELKNILSIFISSSEENPSIQKINQLILKQLRLILNSDIANKGISEVEEILEYVDKLKIKTEIEFDVTLARGLNYYTGAIFEVKALDVEIGSICGGGRYDNLTGIFGLEGVSGVGISFGADRIYDVLTQLNAYPEEASTGTRVLFVNFGKTEEAYSLPLLAKLRAAGIPSEIFPEPAKMKKQLGFADKKGIAYAILIGENEMNTGQITVKDLRKGEQTTVSVNNLVEYFSEK
jgi:histidyl-tRNA synthetase